MPIPCLPSKKFAKFLEKHGCYKDRQSGTSHAIFVRVTKTRKFCAPVQMGKSELDRHYIKLVLQELGFSKDEMQSMFK